MAAFEATVTFAISRVGLNTHTLRTATSLVPNPTVTWPSTNCVLEALISIAADVPAGSDLVSTLVVIGAAAAGYKYVGGVSDWSSIEFWPSLLYTVTVAIWPL